MNFRTFPALVVLALFTFCTHASAQCEDADAAAKTAASMKVEVARMQSALQKAWADAFALLETRGAELGWSREQKAAIVADAQRSSGYLEAGKEAETLKVLSVQQTLKTSEIRDDPIKACKAALEYLPPMRKLDELGAQEVELLRKRITTAK